MELKNNKKKFDWRTMLKCMVCRFLCIHTNKISIYTIVTLKIKDYNKYRFSIFFGVNMGG